jgi:MFS family permease
VALTERATFRALRHRNARLFFGGLWVSQVGSWMQTVAVALQVKRLAPLRWEGLLLGVALASQYVPILLFGAWFGAFADQRNRLRLTMLTQSLMAVQAIGLAVLTFTHTANIPVILVMALLLGVISTIDNPARRGVVIELVDPSGMANVMALNTATMTGSRAMGPAIAAALIPFIGFGGCYLVNGISFAGIVGSLLLIDRSALHISRPAPRGGTPVRDGLRLVRCDPSLARIFIVMVVVSTFAFNYQVALPLLGDKQWHVSDTWFGVLFAVVSAGSFAGSLWVAGRPELTEGMYYGFTALLGVSIVLMSFVPSVWWAVALAVPMGIGGAGFLAVGNALSQLRTPPEMRSRILALVAVAFLGSTPIGGPITGLVGDRLGADWSLAYGGIITMAIVAWGVRAHRRADSVVPVGAVG